MQPYKNIVIEYGHFRLKITDVPRPILFLCASTCVFSEPMPTVDDSQFHSTAKQTTPSAPCRLIKLLSFNKSRLICAAVSHDVFM